jgi:hypothetical protein
LEWAPPAAPKKAQGCRISQTDIDDDLKLISADSDPEFLAAIEAERTERLAIISSAPSTKKSLDLPRDRETRMSSKRNTHKVWWNLSKFL